MGNADQQGQAAGLEIDLDSRTVTRHGQPVSLAPLEYGLLNLLTSNEGRVMTHQSLLTKVWGQDYVQEVDYLKVYIRRLRVKLGDHSPTPELIHTERGIGYIFQVRPTAGNCINQVLSKNGEDSRELLNWPTLKQKSPE